LAEVALEEDLEKQEIDLELEEEKEREWEETIIEREIELE